MTFRSTYNVPNNFILLYNSSNRVHKRRQASNSNNNKISRVSWVTPKREIRMDAIRMSYLQRSHSWRSRSLAWKNFGYPCQIKCQTTWMVTWRRFWRNDLRVILLKIRISEKIWRIVRFRRRPTIRHDARKKWSSRPISASAKKARTQTTRRQVRHPLMTSTSKWTRMRCGPM